MNEPTAKERELARKAAIVMTGSMVKLLQSKPSKADVELVRDKMMGIVKQAPPNILAALAGVLYQIAETNP